MQRSHIDWVRVRSLIIWLVPAILFLGLVYHFSGDTIKEDRINQGERDYEQGHLSSAKDSYDQALEDDSGDAIAYLDRAITLYALEEYERTIKDLNKALDLGLEEPVTAYGVRAAAYYALGQDEEAFTDLARVEKTPPDEHVHYMLAWTYVELEQYELAIPEATLAIEQRHQPIGMAYTVRGNAYRHLDRYDKALDDYNRALDYESDYTSALAGRARTYFEMEEYDRVVQDATRLLEMGYEPLIDQYRLRGEAHYWLEHYEEVIADFSAVIEITPDEACAYDWRASAYWNLSNYPHAIEDATRAIELGCDDLDWILAMRGDSYFQQAMYEEAIADLSEALKIDPDQEWVRDELAAAHNRMNEAE